MAFALALAPIASYAVPGEFNQIRQASVFLKNETNQGSCSGTKIGTTLVLTAAHCGDVTDIMTINNNKVTVLKRDVNDDLMLVKVSLPGTIAISLVSQPPAIDTNIVVVGYPMGIDMWVTEGFVQGYQEPNRMFISAAIAPGNSGGGVFAKDDNGQFKLVGVAVGAYGSFYSIFPHMGVAVDIDTINDFIKRP